MATSEPPGVTGDQQSVERQFSPDGGWWWDGRQWRAAGSTSERVTLAERVWRYYTGPPRRWYSPRRRLVYGFVWAFWTTLLSLGGFAFLLGAQTVTQTPTDAATSFTFGLILLAVAVVSGSYTYRIWTWRARSLYLLIVI
jgi:hypothetical protein